jgi:glucuronokinase
MQVNPYFAKANFFMIRTYAYPRAALIGNPSDGYFGKTIAFIFKNFEASVSLKESGRLQILPCERDGLVYQDMRDLTDSVKENGYYGGVRLIKAAIKVFCEYCTAHDISIPDRSFTISYSSNIPNRLGLAGSSAIVTATFKAIMQFYVIDIPKPILANLILSAEKDELKISAGLQDRVAQVYAEPVYMNFDRGLMEQRGYGEYIPFDKSLLHNLYLAYRTDLSEGSEVLHNNLAARYAQGEPAVLKAIEQWKECTDEVWQKLQSGNKDIAALINRNFDIRSSVCAISEGNKALIDTARSAGASSKFTGSGGAIIGTYTDEKMFEELVRAMKKINAEVIKPEIA